MINYRKGDHEFNKYFNIMSVLVQDCFLLFSSVFLVCAFFFDNVRRIRMQIDHIFDHQLHDIGMTRANLLTLLERAGEQSIRTQLVHNSHVVMISSVRFI